MYFWSYPEWYDVTPDRRRSEDDASTPHAEPHLTVDERLAQDVAQALIDTPAVTGGLVDLHVQNGVAILDGTIDSDDARAAAVAAVGSVPGIRDVCDSLAIR